MKHVVRFAALFLLGLLSLSTAEGKIAHLLPKPQMLTRETGSFMLSQPVRIVYGDDALQCPLLVRFFQEMGAGVTDDASAPVVTVTKVTEIAGAYDYPLAGYDNEAYELTVMSGSVGVKAVTATGVVRAAATLMQMAEGYEGTPELEACTITDWPAFKLRGYMHDVGRSFIDVGELKKEIDLLSRFKVNTFHWHLTDHQAFRFESKHYPALNAAENMTRYPGQYYTQAQCTEVEAYARERGVTVIPEIDMPGHSTAFTVAMGHTMDSPQGRAELAEIIGELAEAFPLAPYLHLGFDETNVSTAFILTMTEAVKAHGKRAACWNPYGNGATPTAAMGVDLLSGWSSRAKDVEGIPLIDSRYNYANHFDLFADVVGIYKSSIDRVEKGNADVAGTVSAYWNDRKNATQDDILRQNNFYANVLATAERAWMGGGNAYIEQGGTTLPGSGSEYEAFADWERRFLFHKDHSLKNEPVPYVCQTHLHWRITDAFPNGGSSTAAFPPETEGPQDQYTYGGKTYGTGLATGGTVYLRHVWGTVVPAFYPAPEVNTTAYAWTYVYSPVEQDAGALIEFQNNSRSEKDQAPPAGAWDHKGSRVWLNDAELLPPVWDNTGKTVGLEDDLGNENCTARPPLPIHLRKGWNKVFLKLPYVALPSNIVRLNKWMFTFVITDTEGRHALDGLVYSPASRPDDPDAGEQTLWCSPDHPMCDGTAPSYRIPAIVRTHEGSLLAVGDHRYHLDDIGNSRGDTYSQIELVFRHSADNGLTWTDSQVLSTNRASTADWNYATGDAAVVADRESDRVLVFCASGIVGIGASTAARPIRVGRFRSDDNGHTWDTGTDVTSSIYGLYGGKATALFITSGSVHQSRYVKVGDYYRIYAAFPVRTSDQGNGTGVMYSDDFGDTWHLLGGTTLPRGSVFEEGRVEELPDGNIVLMVRDDSGRTDNDNAETLARGHKNFNVFTFTDVRTATGSWSTAVSGITGMNNASNNKLLILPAVRSADNRMVHVAVVAMPSHTNGKRDYENNYGRKRMRFYYKELAETADWQTGADMAAGWKEGLTVSDTFAAYSDMVLLDDGRIGLFYEGNGKHGEGLNTNPQTEAYDLIYNVFRLESITDGQYTADTTTLTIVTPAVSPAVSDTIYNLQGQRIKKPSRGIYIAGGRKKVVR